MLVIIEFILYLGILAYHFSSAYVLVVIITVSSYSLFTVKTSGWRTKQGIKSALDKISNDRATMAIAQRLSTATDTDEIIILNGGEIKERGTDAHLLAQNGLWANMWTRQWAKPDAELKLQALNDEDTARN